MNKTFIQLLFQTSFKGSKSRTLSELIVMINKKAIHIREITPYDLELLTNFLQHNDIAKIKRQFNPFPLTRNTAYQIACENHINKYYSAIFEKKIIGLGMLRGWDEGFSIQSLGLLIDKDFQGRGLGKSMLEYLLDEAKRLGNTRIRLTVYATNETAVNLYKSAGFIELSRTLIHINGEDDEKILMCKEL